MSAQTFLKAPFPYFGGKRKAAKLVWQALGDPVSYVEPFAGSLGVLLSRPPTRHPAGFTSEVVNDLDGFVVNAWRSMQFSPDAVACALDWPCTEVDLHARHLALLRWKQECNVDRMLADPEWHDAVMAGWWMWGLNLWIGSGWCSGQGGWGVVDGRFAKLEHGGVHRKMPDVSSTPAISRQMPDVSSTPAISRQMPDVYSTPAISRQMPHLHSAPDATSRRVDYLNAWMSALQGRLRGVKVLQGDWTRCLRPSVLRSFKMRMDSKRVESGEFYTGVFLDPPYSNVASRQNKLYATDSLRVAHDVRNWCANNGDNPEMRIVLAGFEEEHRDLEQFGWRAVEWMTRFGAISGGYAKALGGKETQRRERLWLSPHCASVEPDTVDAEEDVEEEEAD